MPTVSVIGKKDPIAQAAMALWDLCEEDKRVLVEHEQGHTVPRGREVQGQMMQGIRKAIDKAKMMG